MSCMAKYSDCAEIIKGRLYVGSCPQLNEIKSLKRYGISAVLSLQSDADLELYKINLADLERAYRSAGIEFHRAPILDFDVEDLTSKIEECVNRLSRLIEQDHTVLLHCNVGISRGPTVAVGYLMSFGMAPHDAIKQVADKRPRSMPCLEALLALRNALSMSPPPSTNNLPDAS